MDPLALVPCAALSFLVLAPFPALRLRSSLRHRPGRSSLVTDEGPTCTFSDFFFNPFSYGISPIAAPRSTFLRDLRENAFGVLQPADWSLSDAPPDLVLLSLSLHFSLPASYAYSEAFLSILITGLLQSRTHGTPRLLRSFFLPHAR